MERFQLVIGNNTIAAFDELKATRRLVVGKELASVDAPIALFRGPIDAGRVREKSALAEPEGAEKGEHEAP